MALGATIYHLAVTLSDVDRGVYESLDLRVARHPSESARYLAARVLGYCFAYEPGIAFSKGGLSTSDEPPISVRDATGLITHWVEIGAPSAERLHRAAKAAPRVSLFTSAEPGLLRSEAQSRPVHRLEHIEVQRFEPAFLDEFDARLERNTAFELVRNSGQLYLTFARDTLEGGVARVTLSD